MGMALSLVLLVGITTAQAGRFAQSPTNVIITSSYTYPDYNPGWTTNDCADYSFAGLNEAYGRYSDCSTGNQGFNSGWVDDNKETQPNGDCKYEGVDCSAFVGRCWALPGFVPENIQKAHGRSTIQIYRTGYWDKNDVQRSHRVDDAAATVVDELLQCKAWDIFVVNSDAASAIGITQADGTPCTVVNHTGLIRSVSTSNSDVNTREAVVPVVSNVTRSRSWWVDRCARFHRRDDWGQSNTIPVIVAQPLSRTNNIGDNAAFSVTATGASLTYQWKLNGVSIAKATNSALNILVTNISNAGSYQVVVGTTLGASNVTSATVLLVVPYASRLKITQWSFNSVPADADTTTGTVAASLGSGSVSVVGNMTTNTWLDGSSSDPAYAGTDNSGRSLKGPNTTNTPNKSAGFQFNASTVGYKDVVVTWEQNVAQKGCAYWRGQYTTNGTTWIDRVMVDTRTPYMALAASSYTFHFDDLTAVAGVNDNPNFGYRIVGEYQSTATGAGSAAYVAPDTNEVYTTTGAVRWDMVTVLGASLPSGPIVIISQPQSATVSAGADHTFSVTASGTSPRFQWRWNATNIAGATNALFTRTNIQFSQAGSYSVVVTNATSSATSATAVLTVAPPNHAPLIAPISNRTVHAGTTIALNGQAYDSDVNDTLAFSLDPGMPVGATVDAASGVFAWTPSDNDANTSRLITLRVADDGEPSLASTTTFTVSVQPRPTIKGGSISGNTLTLSWNAIAGVAYRVEFKDNLEDTNWQTLGFDVVSEGSVATVEDPEFGSNPQRFYRILIVE
jgi:hypothetical protein